MVTEQDANVVYSKLRMLLDAIHENVATSSRKNDRWNPSVSNHVPLDSPLVPI